MGYIVKAPAFQMRYPERGAVGRVRPIANQRCTAGWYSKDDPYVTYTGIAINAWYSRVYRFPKTETRTGKPCVGVGPQRNRRTRGQCLNYRPDPFFRYSQYKSCLDNWRSAAIGYGGKVRSTRNNVFLYEPILGTPLYDELMQKWRINNTTTMELYRIGSRNGACSACKKNYVVLVINNLRHEISYREFLQRISGTIGQQPVQIQGEGWQTYSNGLQSRQITNTFKLCNKCKPITRSYTIWKDLPRSLTKTQTTTDFGIDMSAPGRNAPTSGFKAKTRFLTNPGEVINWSVDLDILDEQFVKNRII